MIYRLIITKRAEELLDEIISYILFKLKNEMAARHLLNEIDILYNRLEENPYQFPDCTDSYLESKGYKKAVVIDMNYVVIFRVDIDIVYILGIFHQLESYKEKIT